MAGWNARKRLHLFLRTDNNTNDNYYQQLFLDYFVSIATLCGGAPTVFPAGVSDAFSRYPAACREDLGDGVSSALSRPASRTSPGCTSDVHGWRFLHILRRASLHIAMAGCQRATMYTRSMLCISPPLAVSEAWILAGVHGCAPCSLSMGRVTNGRNRIRRPGRRRPGTALRRAAVCA